MLDDTGRPSKCPDLDVILPPVPPGLANSRPRLWFTGPNVVSAPKRERELSPGDSDVTSDIPEAKRRLSETHYERQYGTAPALHPGQRYSLDVINRNPLRAYPSAAVLYGMETDSTLLTDQVFTAPQEAGREKDRPFIRG